MRTIPMKSSHFPLRFIPNRFLIFGLAIGIFLGGLFIRLASEGGDEFYDENLLEKEGENAPSPFFSLLPKQMLKNEQSIEHQQQKSLSLRCVILLESDNEKPFVAIKDTWAKECNKTLFFTNSALLQTRYRGNLMKSMQILQIQNFGGDNIDDWPFISKIITFLSDEENGGEKWTIIADGQSYIHIANLRSLLSKVRDDSVVIVGRRKVRRNDDGLYTSEQLSEEISLCSGNVPLIFSRAALRLLSFHCSEDKSSHWFWRMFNPTKNAGQEIAKCSRRLGISLWDPVDMESRPLIVTDSLRMAFSRKAKNATKILDENAQRQSMPSDRAIAFAMLSPDDLRLVDYGVRRLKLFGAFERH